MAKFIFKSYGGLGYNFDQDVFGDDEIIYDYESFSPTRIRVYDDNLNYAQFGGTGFTRNGGGTIQSFVQSVDGILVGQLSGLSIKIKTLLSYENDPAGLAYLMFSGNDEIYGTNLNDLLRGAGGNDYIRSSLGNDYVYGGIGQDTLFGGYGKDTLNGGLDADKFYYGSFAEGNDVIQGFAGDDSLVFEGSSFGLGNYSGTLRTANFCSRGFTNKALDWDDRFVFNRSDDTVWYDADGSRNGFAPVKIANLSNDFYLTFHDILRECQESCARGHSDHKERITWLSRKNYWTSFWLAATRRSCLPRTVCWMI